MTDAPEMVDGNDTSWARRVRSGMLLGLLSTMLGIAIAAFVGVALVATTSLLDHALG